MNDTRIRHYFRLDEEGVDATLISRAGEAMSCDIEGVHRFYEHLKRCSGALCGQWASECSLFKRVLYFARRFGIVSKRFGRHTCFITLKVKKGYQFASRNMRYRRFCLYPGERAYVLMHAIFTPPPPHPETAIEQAWWRKHAEEDDLPLFLHEALNLAQGRKAQRDVIDDILAPTDSEEDLSEYDSDGRPDPVYAALRSETVLKNWETLFPNTMNSGDELFVNERYLMARTMSNTIVDQRRSTRSNFYPLCATAMSLTNYARGSMDLAVAFDLFCLFTRCSVLDISCLFDCGDREVQPRDTELAKKRFCALWTEHSEHVRMLFALARQYVLYSAPNMRTEENDAEEDERIQQHITTLIGKYADVGGAFETLKPRSNGKVRVEKKRIHEIVMLNIEWIPVSTFWRALIDTELMLGTYRMLKEYVSTEETEKELCVLRIANVENFVHVIQTMQWVMRRSSHIAYKWITRESDYTVVRGRTAVYLIMRSCFVRRVRALLFTEWRTNNRRVLRPLLALPTCAPLMHAYMRGDSYELWGAMFTLLRRISRTTWNRAQISMLAPSDRHFSSTYRMLHDILEDLYPNLADVLTSLAMVWQLDRDQYVMFTQEELRSQQSYKNWHRDHQRNIEAAMGYAQWSSSASGVEGDSDTTSNTATSDRTTCVDPEHYEPSQFRRVYSKNSDEKSNSSIKSTETDNDSTGERNHLRAVRGTKFRNIYRGEHVYKSPPKSPYDKQCDIIFSRPFLLRAVKAFIEMRMLHWIDEDTWMRLHEYLNKLPFDDPVRKTHCLLAQTFFTGEFVRKAYEMNADMVKLGVMPPGTETDYRHGEIPISQIDGSNVLSHIMFYRLCRDQRVPYDLRRSVFENIYTSGLVVFPKPMSSVAHATGNYNETTTTTTTSKKSENHNDAEEEEEEEEEEEKEKDEDEHLVQVDNLSSVPYSPVTMITVESEDSPVTKSNDKLGYPLDEYEQMAMREGKTLDSTVTVEEEEEEEDKFDMAKYSVPMNSHTPCNENPIKRSRMISYDYVEPERTNALLELMRVLEQGQACTAEEGRYARITCVNDMCKEDFSYAEHKCTPILLTPDSTFLHECDVMPFISMRRSKSERRLFGNRESVLLRDMFYAYPLAWDGKPRGQFMPLSSYANRHGSVTTSVPDDPNDALEPLNPSRVRLPSSVHLAIPSSMKRVEATRPSSDVPQKRIRSTAY